MRAAVGVFYFRRYQAGVSPISAEKASGVYTLKALQIGAFRVNDRVKKRFCISPMEK